MPVVKIDNLKREVPDGWTVLEAAKFLGIEIPTLCYDEGLSSGGNCRLCIVEIGSGKSSKLVTSCTYPVNDGLVIRTASKRVVKARNIRASYCSSTIF